MVTYSIREQIRSSGIERIAVQPMASLKETAVSVLGKVQKLQEILTAGGKSDKQSVACMEPPHRGMGGKLVVKNLDEFRRDEEKVQPAESLEHTPDRRSQAG